MRTTLETPVLRPDPLGNQEGLYPFVTTVAGDIANSDRLSGTAVRVEVAKTIQRVPG